MTLHKDSRSSYLAGHLLGFAAGVRDTREGGVLAWTELQAERHPPCEQPLDEFNAGLDDGYQDGATAALRTREREQGARERHAGLLRFLRDLATGGRPVA